MKYFNAEIYPKLQEFGLDSNQAAQVHNYILEEVQKMSLDKEYLTDCLKYLAIMEGKDQKIEVTIK